MRDCCDSHEVTNIYRIIEPKVLYKIEESRVEREKEKTEEEWRSGIISIFLFLFKVLWFYKYFISLRVHVCVFFFDREWRYSDGKEKGGERKE